MNRDLHLMWVLGMIFFGEIKKRRYSVLSGVEANEWFGAFIVYVWKN